MVISLGLTALTKTLKKKKKDQQVTCSLSS